MSFNVDGPSVTIQWSAVPGATIYDVVVSGALSGQVQLPGSVTLVRVNAPNGTYGIQVRGRAGNQVGPLSSVAVITVGAPAPPPPPPNCTQPSAPNVTATVSGATVAVNWNTVSGATAYAVQFSRTPGGTETRPERGCESDLGFAGGQPHWHLLRPCGRPLGLRQRDVERSQLHDRHDAASPATGPRSPNPAPGQLISRSSLGYANGIAAQVASQYRGELLNSCRETGGDNTFMYRLVQALRRVDTRWGMNDKRGQRGDMSQDIVTFNPTDRPDNGESQIYLFDAIGGHCGPNPSGGSLGDVTNDTWSARGNPACGTTYCARWTIDNYLRAGFTP